MAWLAENYQTMLTPGRADSPQQQFNFKPKILVVCALVFVYSFSPNKCHRNTIFIALTEPKIYHS